MKTIAKPWVGAALLAVLLAALFAPRLAPVWLAASLPAALALSPSLRRDGAFAPWIVAAVPAALALWGLAAGRGQPWTVACCVVGTLLFVVSPGKAKPFLAALGVLVCLVAYFSSGHGGSEPMMHWYERFGLTEAQAHLLTVGFRKTVHFTFYGTVGWTALRAARSAEATPNEAIRTALLAALAVAVFDETRQLGYANRSASPWDVALDLAGALAFVGLSEWRRRKGR